MAVWATCILLSQAQTALADPWNAPPEAAGVRSPVEDNDATVAVGKSVYVKRCIGCHGDSGKGDGPDASDLSIAPKDISDPSIINQSEGALFWKIQTGRKPMPKFGNRLSDTEIWSVIKYFKTFSK